MAYNVPGFAKVWN